MTANNETTTPRTDALGNLSNQDAEDLVAKALKSHRTLETKLTAALARAERAEAMRDNVQLQVEQLLKLAERKEQSNTLLSERVAQLEEALKGVLDTIPWLVQGPTRMVGLGHDDRIVEFPAFQAARQKAQEALSAPPSKWKEQVRDEVKP